MGIIRFSDDEVFDTDSSEYEILINAVEQVGDTPGAIVEIGTRRGGSAKMIIDTLVANGGVGRNMFCIDPYGNIEIECTNINITAHQLPNACEVKGDPNSLDEVQSIKLDYYDNTMRNRIVPSLYYYAFNAGLEFQFFFLEDTEFFEKFENGVPVYNEGKSIVNEYAFVFFDGPHTLPLLMAEVVFFLSRANVGTVFVFDDIWMYNHASIEEALDLNNFKLLHKGNVKASYIKDK